MVVLNGMSRYHLCIEALRVRERTPTLITACRDLGDQVTAYAREHLEDMPGSAIGSGARRQVREQLPAAVQLTSTRNRRGSLALLIPGPDADRGCGSGRRSARWP